MRCAIRRTRVDTTQTAIVEALRAAGCLVFVIGYPCDLLVFVPITSTIQLSKIGLQQTPPWAIRTLECKSTQRRRKDQPGQDEFLERTGTPRVKTPEEALIAVGLA